MELRDSRRLTGANLLQAGPGAVIDVAVAAGERGEVIAAWQEVVGRLLRDVAWERERTAVREHAQGVSLAISAPIDALYAACEINEAAFDAVRTRDAVAAEAVGELRRMVKSERNPALLALRAAAAEHGVAFVWDDDHTSLGLGAGSRTFPTDDLPSPDAVNWKALHDVPVVLVTGTNGKSTTVRLLASIASAAGRTPGLSSTDWVRVGDEIVDRGDYSGPGGARLVLRDPRTEIAILETARGGLLRRGLSVERADVAAILNVAEDHLGEFGVDDLATLVEVKFLLARAVEGHGKLVLNAEDADVRRRGANVDAERSWFGLDSGAVDQGPACVLDDGIVTLVRGSERVPVVAADEIPVTLGGHARFHIANALAATAIADAVSLPVSAIADGLRSFASTPAENPGRGNLFELGGVTVYADFAHNAHGYRAVFELARSLPAQRRLSLLGQAGDRTDAAIRDLARITWQARPDRVILKEMQEDLRGREAGEVTALLRDELRRCGAPESSIGYATSELEAVRDALRWARKDDLLLLLLHAERPACLELLQSLRERGWRPGEPIE